MRSTRVSNLRLPSWSARLGLGLVIPSILLLSAAMTSAQTTSFTYQGRLTDGGTAANGNYDLQFALFDSLTGGFQVAVTQTVSAVSVSAGIFSAQLDFGVNAFPGANRFLGISVRPSGNGSFTTLAPRQQIAATPYAIRTLSATTADGLSSACLGCVQDSQINSVAGSKVTGPIPVVSVPGGSSSYIQNSTTQQSSSNFNVSGNGTAGGTLSANTVNATTQYNIGGNRVLSNPGSLNLFAGAGAGSSNTTGNDNAFFGSFAGSSNTAGVTNAFFGRSAGQSNTTGSGNAFFGSFAGLSNTTGGGNAFYGVEAGLSNTTGGGNAFYGVGAGQFNTTGGNNAFYGTNAGQRNTTGSQNAFFGLAAGFSNTQGSNNAFYGGLAGQFNTTGGNNAFFGQDAGSNNTTGQFNAFYGEAAGNNNATGGGNAFFGQAAGSKNATGSLNTLIGWGSDVGSGDLLNATAIGAGALVSRSDSLVLGNIGVNVGIGTSAPQAKLDVQGGDVFVGLTAVPDINATPGDNLYLANTNGDANNSLRLDGFNNNLYIVARSAPGSSAGTGIVFRTAAAGGGELDRVGIDSVGRVGIGTSTPDQLLSVNGNASKVGGGSWATFSDERLKNIKGRFTPGLKAVMQLQPLRYEYKRDNALGIKSEGEFVGFSAQAVEKVIPEAVTKNDKGYLLINNDPIMWTMLNAIKEQQVRIERQQEQLARERATNAAQQQQLNALKNLVCHSRRRVSVCK